MYVSRKVLILLAAVLVACVVMWFYSRASPPFKEILLSEVLPPQEPTLIAEPPSEYIEVTDGCGPYHEGTCVNVRSGPGSSYPVVMGLRTGIVLPVASSTVVDADGREWNKISFTEWIRYPERVSDDWYVAAEYVQRFVSSDTNEATTTKHILIDRSEQKLYAYEGDEVFMEMSVSTGLDLTPTPRGTFTVYRKTPSRYMQGPLPGISDQYYDLPGVPWNLYFTNEGGAIHGAYWHNQFGSQWSHGCVNLPLDRAKELYEWAPVGTEVVVRD